MKSILITVQGITLSAELDDTENATAIANALPLVASANVWGDEIYFEIPVHLQEEATARAEVELGTLAYWPPGNAFCIFYGATPVSVDGKPRAYSPVNIIGHVIDDVTVLRSVKSGAEIRIESAG